MASIEAAPTDSMRSRFKGKHAHDFEEEEGEIFSEEYTFLMIGGQVMIEQVNHTRETGEENGGWGGVRRVSRKRFFFFSG